MTQQTMQVEEFDLTDAPEMPSGIFTNYGKLTLTQKWVAWKEGKTVEVSRDEYKAIAAKDGEGKGAKQIDMEFAVDLQEFKPSLSFTYARKVTVESLDWNKIIVPSVAAVFGKDSMSKENRNATLAKLQGKYVSYQDVLQTPTKKKPDPKYNCFKLVKVYESREACYVDFVASGGNKIASDNGTGGGFDESVSTPQDPNLPTGFDAETWAGVKGDVQTEVTKQETPLLAAFNAKHAKLPKPAFKKALDAEMPSIRAQAMVNAAASLSTQWEMVISAGHVKQLLEA